MKTDRKVLRILFFSFILFLGACVTINIYFPAEKVESVAGEIVDEIRGKKTEGKQESDQKTQSALNWKKLAVLSPSLAWASDATEVSNAAIRALKQRMKERFAQMKAYFQKGMLAEGDDGYVALGSIDSLDLKSRRDLKNLVDAENNDRRSLYMEVAKALNIDPGQLSKIESIFAKEWQKSLQ